MTNARQGGYGGGDKSPQVDKAVWGLGASQTYQRNGFVVAEDEKIIIFFNPVIFDIFVMSVKKIGQFNDTHLRK